ncbi:ATP synthase delta chain [hydrothermal vent metagenome]|uniref:ATP synthase delta chain n=1 Tax=hydrothermal vent metagenome TaxID=652676 RepID=A0A3B0ZZT8_9ZZZZ
MAEISTIARPYAEAVFELAQAGGTLKAWSEMLQTLALITADPDMQALIGNTSVDKAKLAGLILDITGKATDEQGRNLVKLLAENRRLGALGEIAVQFETLKAEAEQTIEAEIVSASEVSKEQQQKIADKLKARLGRDVSLKCTIDESLMGGAVIKAGDMVIDGSVRTQLEKLSVELAG